MNLDWGDSVLHVFSFIATGRLSCVTGAGRREPTSHVRLSSQPPRIGSVTSAATLPLKVGVNKICAFSCESKLSLIKLTRQLKM